MTIKVNRPFKLVEFKRGDHITPESNSDSFFKWKEISIVKQDSRFKRFDLGQVSALVELVEQVTV